MNDPIPLRQSARIQKRILLWLGLGLAAVAVLIVASALVHRAVAESAVRKKLAELEAAGVTVSGEAANRRYHGHGRDPKGNAAPVYDEAFAQKETPREAMNELSKVMGPGLKFEPLDPNALEEIRELLAANETAINLFKEAAANSYLRYELDFTEGPLLLVPHIGDLRDGVRLLAAESILAAEDGDAARAAEALEAIFQIPLHLAEESTTISHLTTIAMERVGRAALERVLDRIELPPSSLAALTERMRKLETPSRMNSVMHGEVAFGMTTFHMLEEGDEELMEGEERWWKPFISLYRISGLMARDKYFYLSHMEEFLRAVEQPVSERVKRDFPDLEVSSNPIHGQIISGILVPTMGRVFEADARALAYLRATQVGLAAEQYRLKNGSFPSAPEDLVPEYLEELPLDPYGEDGFRFVSEADAFFVRSAEVIDLPRDEGQVQIGFRLPVR